jgi:hypothetical protein
MRVGSTGKPQNQLYKGIDFEPLRLGYFVFPELSLSLVGRHLVDQLNHWFLISYLSNEAWDTLSPPLVPLLITPDKRPAS